MYGSTCIYSKSMDVCHIKLLLFHLKAWQLYKSIFRFQFTTTTVTSTNNDSYNSILFTYLHMRVFKIFRTTNMLFLSAQCNHLFTTVCSTKRNVLCRTLTTIPVIRHAMPMPTVSRSNSLNLIWAPVSPNRIGSKIIQNISNAVATGFWKIFTIHVARKE